MKGGKRVWIPLFMGLCCLLVPGTAAAAVGETTATVSTTHHRYDVYLGTIQLVRQGASAPYRTEAVFESEIRFDQEAIEQYEAALAPDSRFKSGITTTTAPDGGSWITSAPDHDWWEMPNGSVEDQPLFDAGARFARAPQLLLAPGETLSCTNSDAGETVLQDDKAAEPKHFPYVVKEGVYTEGANPPITIWVGDDRSERRDIVFGEANVDVETSFLVLTVHKLTRTCVVSPPPAPPPPADRCATGADTDHDLIADACDEDPSIPDSCALRVARSRVFVYRSKPKARLVVKYKTRSPALVKTTYTATLANGKKLILGSLKKNFGAEGTFKLPVALAEDAAEKVRSARSFTVAFSIPDAPKACAAAYTKQLTKKATVGKQSVWFQSDSVLGGLF